MPYIGGIRKWADAWFFTFKAKRSRKPSRAVNMKNLLNIFLQGRENVDVIAETQHDKCFSWTVERCREVKSGQIEETDAVWELSCQRHWIERKINKSPFTCNEYSPKLFPWFHNINHVIATLSFGEVRLLLQNRTSCLSGLFFVCNLRVLNPEHHWIVSKTQRTTVFFCETCFNSSCKSCAALISRFVRKKTELVIEIHERS